MPKYVNPFLSDPDKSDPKFWENPKRKPSTLNPAQPLHEPLMLDIPIVILLLGLRVLGDVVQVEGVDPRFRMCPGTLGF